MEQCLEWARIVMAFLNVILSLREPLKKRKFSLSVFSDQKIGSVEKLVTVHALRNISTVSARCMHKCCLWHSFELLRNNNLLALLWTVKMSTLQQQQQQRQWQQQLDTHESAESITRGCAAPAHAAQQLRFLSCATGSTAALRLPRATAHGGRTAAPIVLQSQWGVQGKGEGKTEGERVLLLNKWRRGAASRCHPLSVEKRRITKGCGQTLGCNFMMQTVRMCSSLTLCLTLSRTSQRARCTTVVATSALVSRLAAAGVRPSRLTLAREGYDHNARRRSSAHTLTYESNAVGMQLHCPTADPR